MVIEFDVTENKQERRPDGEKITDSRLIRVNFRPLPGSPIHSNIFHMQLPPTATRLSIDRGRLITESGKLVSPVFDDNPDGEFPAEDRLDPYQRVTVTRNTDAEITRNIEAYWERKLKASDEGRPYPQHHQSTLALVITQSSEDNYTYYTPPSNNKGSPEAINTISLRVVGGSYSTGVGFSYNGAFFFPGVSGLSGVTINTAVFGLTGFSTDTGTPQTLVSAEDVASPTVYTTKTLHDEATRTSAGVTWDNCDLVTTGFVNAPDISTVIQELADSFDPTAIYILWDDDLTTDSDNRSRAHSYDSDPAKSAKLDIDFTAGGAPTTRRYNMLTMGVG